MSADDLQQQHLQVKFHNQWIMWKFSPHRRSRDLP